MIKLTHRGNFNNIENFLRYVQKIPIVDILRKYGEKGLKLLEQNTPIKTGLTASSWTFRVQKDRSGYSIIWENSNIVQNTPIALILQYGHGTGTGGYVQGIDYINPVLKEVFESMSEEIWREVIDK